jgi:hypothetical protein
MKWQHFDLDGWNGGWSYGDFRFTVVERVLNVWESNRIIDVDTWPYVTDSEPLKKLIRIVFEIKTIKMETPR